jgi:hypothetical protein
MESSERHLRGAAKRPPLEVADILRAHFTEGEAMSGLAPEQRHAVRDIMRCRTAALGGHLQRCTACGDERPAYNSCRNRHCPKCQALPQARWVQKQAARVLPVTCFHVVFTLPAELRPVVKARPRELNKLLFEAASSTLLTLGRDPKRLGAELGITAVLHTWTRDLSLHPHVHCIVTAGGLAANGTWRDTERGYLFPVAVMAKLFRGKFLHGLCQLRREQGVASHLGTDAFDALVRKLYDTAWNVYSKAPFAGPTQIFDYLGRYTHRVGISNRRLVAFDDRGVTFRTRGRDTVTLATGDFVRRFLSHVLPRGFVKIRHYGLMANGGAVKRREQARALLLARQPSLPVASAAPPDASWQQRLEALTGVDVARCPACGERAVVRLPLPRPPSLAKARCRAPPHAEATA